MYVRNLFAIALVSAVGFSAHAAEPAAAPSPTLQKMPAQPVPPAVQPKAERKRADEGARQPVDEGTRPPSAVRKRPEAQIQDGAAQVLKQVRPDLVVEVAAPTSPSQPAIATVRNVGTAPTQSGFTVVSTIEGWCEAGKLKSQIATNDGSQNLDPIPAGSFRYVMVRPASQVWGNSGCYYRVSVRADSWEQIPETNETNNTGYAHFCPAGGTCY